MSIPGRAEAAVKGLVLWIGLGLAVMGIVFVSLGFLISGFFFWVERYKSHDIAAAVTGGALLALAVVIATVGQISLKRMKRRQPPLISEFTGILVTAGRIVGLLIRKDPRKSMIIAVIAGAVAEYITSGDKRKK